MVWLNVLGSTGRLYSCVFDGGCLRRHGHLCTLWQIPQWDGKTHSGEHHSPSQHYSCISSWNTSGRSTTDDITLHPSNMAKSSVLGFFSELHMVYLYESQVTVAWCSIKGNLLCGWRPLPHSLSEMLKMIMRLWFHLKFTELAEAQLSLRMLCLIEDTTVLLIGSLWKDRVILLGFLWGFQGVRKHWLSIKLHFIELDTRPCVVIA